MEGQLVILTLIFIAGLPFGLPIDYNRKWGKCFEGEIYPVNQQNQWIGYSCYDKEGNEYKTDKTILSCCGCIKLTCHTIQSSSGYYGGWKSFWNVSKENTCCKDCHGKVYPIGAVINSQSLKDNCSTTVTQQCVARSQGKKSVAIISDSFEFKSCCLDSTGLYPIGEIILDQKSCSTRNCSLHQGNLHASWDSSIKECPGSGCDCCVYDGQLICDGGHVTLKNGVNATCCEGQLLVTPTPGNLTITDSTTTRCPQAQLIVNTANAVNNNALDAVLVTLLEQGQVLDQTTTSAGQGNLTSPHSEVVLTAELAGFTMAPVTIIVRENECDRTIELSLSPNTSFPVRVVMNWGPLPKDLDLHVIQVKNDSEICHVFFSNKTCDGYALDVDNTDGGDKGAETITWSSVDKDSEYVMFVHDYTGGNTSLSSSGARIALYRENMTTLEYYVPNNGSSDRFWIIGCFNNHGFTVMNKLVTTEPNDCSAQGGSRRSGQKVIYPQKTNKENNHPQTSYNLAIQ